MRRHVQDPLLRDAAAIGLAVGTFAVSFGALATSAGAGWGKAMTLSLLVFTGASQFAFIGVVAAGGGALAAMAPAVVLMLRNTLYGISVAPLLREDGPLRRLAVAHLVIDESTAMARAQRDPAQGRRALIATGVSILVCWNVGTAAGVAFGQAIGDPRALGLDAMFPAAFLALLAPHLRRPGTRPLAALGALLALALVPWAPAGVPVVASCVLVALHGRARRLEQRAGLAPRGAGPDTSRPGERP